MKKLIPIIIAAAVLAPMFFVHSCANTTEAPTGGIKDTIPPYITEISPAPGTVNVPVHGQKFVFTFNEYVSIKNQQNILISPPQQKALKCKIQGKNLVITTEEDLLPNTTYTFSFTDALADVNESNPFPGYSYVFSTGSAVDSMLVTGTVLNCSTLMPFKGATVLLYKDHSDSAVFRQRPDAYAKTDDWGYFRIPFVKDTLYRLYAIKDESNNRMYDPESDLVAFADSLVRPDMKVDDTMPEMLNYEMSDTLSCQSRRSRYELLLFKEKTSKQGIKNEKRTAERAAYVSFLSPDAWIDSLWVAGFKSNQVITEFNLNQDSLLVWVNSRKPMPDTLHLFVNYRKTDSLGRLSPTHEHLKLTLEGKKKPASTYLQRKNLQHTDTICGFKVDAPAERIEQDGLALVFDFPIISGQFDSLVLQSVNTRQRVTREKFTVEKDSTNLRRFIIHPSFKFQKGYEYVLKVPHRIFRDINGFYSDSLDFKVSLPSDDELSNLSVDLQNVDRKVIVDLLDENNKINRSYVVTEDITLSFPYLRKGKYKIRLTEDANNNSIVDVGALLEHRQPEKVLFFKIDDKPMLDIPESAEISQSIDVRKLFKFD